MTKTNTTEQTIADRIVDYMKQYIVFADEAQADVLALWVLHTHCMDFAYTTPYIYVTAAERACGKTRVIEVLRELAHNPVAGNMSPGALYAAIGGDSKPTLFIDEVDNVFTGSDMAKTDLRDMLNQGYKRSGHVLRQGWEDGDRSLKSYSVFAPKMLVGIDNGGMPDTLESRCIRIVLKRRKMDQPIRDFLIWEVEEESATLKADIQNWAVDMMDKLHEARSNVKRLDGVSDRAFEIAHPLLALANCLPGWGERTREALTALQAEEADPLSPQAQALTKAQEWFSEHPMKDRIPSATLAELMSVNGKQLGSWMSPYGISPRSVKYNGIQTRCYFKNDFEDAWERYL